MTLTSTLSQGFVGSGGDTAASKLPVFEFAAIGLLGYDEMGKGSSFAAWGLRSALYVAGALATGLTEAERKSNRMG